MDYKLPVFTVFIPCLINQIVPTNGNVECSTKLDVCPPGHQMFECSNGGEGYYCKQCGELSFQPDKSRFGDRCRLRKRCNTQFHMKYKEYGSTIKDADCECFSGYHFEADDQRACVPNRDCEKGFGQGPYGRCLDCLSKNMYSDKHDRLQKCIPLTNCEKTGRCTTTKSNGSNDNVCGPIVRDVSQCDNIRFENQPPADSPQINLIIGCTVGSVIVFVIVLIVAVMCWRRKHANTRKHGNKRKHLTKEQLEQLHCHIIAKAEEDKTYCEKVLSASFRAIEDGINRQIWKLAQELFRNHPQPSKYEVIVEKYKENNEKYAVNGYLQDWREWKHSCPQAIEELFACLKQCGREDIMYIICNQFHDDDYKQMVYGGNAKKRSSKASVLQEMLWTIFPCTRRKDRQDDGIDCKDTTNSKLLEVQVEPPAELKPQDAGVVYRHHPSPSAPPVFVDDNNMNVDVPTGLHRALSYPVQASS